MFDIADFAAKILKPEKIYNLQDKEISISHISYHRFLPFLFLQTYRPNLKGP
jgi:hypothetical protein